MEMYSFLVVTRFNWLTGCGGEISGLRWGVELNGETMKRNTLADIEIKWTNRHILPAGLYRCSSTSSVNVCIGCGGVGIKVISREITLITIL